MGFLGMDYTDLIAAGTSFMVDAMRYVKVTFQVMTVVAVVSVAGGMIALGKAFHKWWYHDRHEPPEDVWHVRAHLWREDEE